MFSKDKYKNLTDKQRWELVDIAVRAFITEYPKACEQFFAQMETRRTKYGLVEDKELQKSNHRCTLSFPVVKNGEDEDCLLPIIERYIPGFARSDSPYYKEFIKRYPKFSMAEKL